MERAEILLAQVERAVEFGVERVREQRNFIAQLERDGRESDAAFERAVLAILESSLRLSLDDQERLSRALVDFDRDNMETGTRADRTDG